MLGSDIRHLATIDPLLVRCGTNTFILMVLVPELAVRLIQEDLVMNAVAVKYIRKESGRIGSVLNDDN